MPASSATKAVRPRLTREDWINAATEVMVDSSVEHVRVESLARDLNLSKGSFYWHFRNRDDLLRGVLEKWTEDATLAVQERLYQREPLASRRLLLVLRLPLRSPRSVRAADLELAILGWARRSRMAEQAVAKVDELRIAHIATLFEDMGLTPPVSRIRAHMAYGFIRYIAQRRDLDAKERLDMTTIVHAMLMEGATPPGAAGDGADAVVKLGAGRARRGHSAAAEPLEPPAAKPRRPKAGDKGPSRS